jgi:hypothetical protein
VENRRLPTKPEYRSMTKLFIVQSLFIILIMCLQATANTPNNPSMQPTNNLRQQTLHSFTTPLRRRTQQDKKLPTNYWGDYLGPKDPAHLRVYLQNPNRISAANDFTDFQYLCQVMYSNDIDIFGLSETGLDWKQHGPRSRCRQILDDFWTHSRLITSTSDAPSEQYTQFGGTCTGVTGKWSGRIAQQGMDPHGLGRWSHVCITGKNGGKKKTGDLI